MAALFVGLYACSENTGNNSNDDAEVGAFREEQLTLLNAGKIKNHRVLIHNTDSFLALKHNVSPYFQQELHISKSRDYYELGEYDSSSIFADSAIYIIETNDFQKEYPTNYVNALTLKGQALYATNQFKQAYTYYFKAKKLSEKLKDTCSSHEFTYRLAMIAYKQKKYTDAAKYFKRSYLSASACDNAYPYVLQEYLDNVGLSYEKMNIHDSALYYYDSALLFINRNAGSFPSSILIEKALAVVYGNIGGLYLTIGKTDTAIALLKKSFSINIQPGYDNTDALLTHLKLANAYLNKKDMAALTLSLAAIEKELDSIAHPLEAKTSWHNLMYRVNNLSGDAPAALLHMQKYTTLRDSLWQLEKKQLQNDLASGLKDKEQVSEIDMLQKQNQLNNLYLWVTIGFAILALIIIALIYANYRRERKNILRLKQLNSQINDQKSILERTTEQLKQSSNDKDRILYVVAHDLRNPVGAIMALTDIIRQEELTVQQKQILDMIMNALRSEEALIAELLEYSGDAKGRIPAKKEQVNINSLLKNCVDLMQFKAREKGQSLQLSLPTQLLTATINKEKISRVWSNLISNAIKFSKENSAIYVSLSQSGVMAVIEVKDNGIGIPEKFKPMIFEPFTSAKRYGTAGEESFGLGLSICKQIVDANDGKIWFESTEGTGTSFFVALPLETNSTIPS